MTTLKDAPGGMAFARCLAAAVDDLSLAYAHTPDNRAAPHLEAFLRSIEPAIVEAVGARKAPIWLDAFRGAVMTRKRKIEARSGPTGFTSKS
jgi:hypothetical protein